MCRKQGHAPKKKRRQNGCGEASSSSKTRGSGSRTEELQSGSGKKEAEAREDEDDDPETEGSYKTWSCFEQSEEEEATEEATSATLPRGSVGEALARNILYWEQTPESPLSPLTPDPLPTPLALAQPSPAGRGSVVGMETLPRGPIADDAHNRAADEDRGKAPVEAKGEKGEPDGLDARDRVTINGLVGDLYVTVPKDDEWTELDDMLFEASAFLKEVKPA